MNFLGTDVRTLKRKNEFVRGQYRTTHSPILPIKSPILGPNVLKTHVSITQSYICLKCTRIAEIFASYTKSRSRMVTSDFRPEVEIRPFRACSMHPVILPEQFLQYGRGYGAYTTFHRTHFLVLFILQLRYMKVIRYLFVHISHVYA